MGPGIPPLILRYPTISPMKLHKSLKLSIAIAVSELAGIVGSFFTAPATLGWYGGIVKPAMNPPAWVFGTVWVTLFALMGIAAFLIWEKGVERSLKSVSFGSPLWPPSSHFQKYPKWLPGFWRPTSFGSVLRHTSTIQYGL